MTFMSFAQGCRRLGIDAKTLHRWLADAQLSLHCHPHDGRQKGVSEEHLQVLARLHQRSLAGLPEVPPTPETFEVPALSAALLVLPEQLCTLQAQLAALQQQVAALTHLLEQHEQGPALWAAPTKPPSTTRHPPKPASPAPRTRRAAKPLRKATHVIPRVEYGGEGHYVVICPKQGLLTLSPDTPAWFAWLATQSSFRFVGKGGSFSAHHEGRIPKGAWRAHRHIRNHGFTRRLAPSHELTIAVLEQAAQALQAHLM